MMDPLTKTGPIPGAVRGQRDVQASNPMLAVSVLIKQAEIKRASHLLLLYKQRVAQSTRHEKLLFTSSLARALNSSSSAHFTTSDSGLNACVCDPITDGAGSSLDHMT